MNEQLFGLLPLVLIFAVFYFLLIAPMRRQQKQRQEMIAKIKPGDKVITNGGIYGTVAAVKDEVVQLRIADQVKVDLARNAIQSLQKEP